MTVLRRTTALALCALITACGTTPGFTSRNAPFEPLPPAETAAAEVPAAQQTAAQPVAALGDAMPAPSMFTINDINVVVPQHLSVSEANLFYPSADIVWRGDPAGDRQAQVQAIVEAGLREGTQDMVGATPVVMDVQLVRFHSITEKARYSVGGVHNVIFDMTLRRASTGQPVAPTRRVEMDFPALGGREAIAADQAGQTQKVRVTGALSQLIRHELARYVPS